MNIMGHWYVNSSNMNLERKHLLYTNSSKYRDFCLVPVFAPIFWLVSSMLVLRAPKDIYSTAGEEYTWWNVFFFNMLAWTLPYFIGLQFTHLDKGPMQKFSFTPDKMKEWPWFLWAFTAFLVVVLLGLMAYFITVYARAGVLLGYFIFGLCIVLAFLLPTLVLRKSYKLHVHHYTIGMILIALIGYQSVVAAIVHGFCNGMMIEGGCRWGYDPIWYPLPKEDQQTAANPPAGESKKPDIEAGGSQLQAQAPAEVQAQPPPTGGEMLQGASSPVASPRADGPVALEGGMEAPGDDQI